MSKQHGGGLVPHDPESPFADPEFGSHLIVAMAEVFASTALKQSDVPAGERKRIEAALASLKRNLPDLFEKFWLATDRSALFSSLTGFASLVAASGIEQAEVLRALTGQRAQRMRDSKKNKPWRLAMYEAIAAEIDGKDILKPYAKAGQIRTAVNKRLSKAGHKPVSQDQIYRRLSALLKNAEKEARDL